jgi:flagellar hook-length control protein FliK
MRTPAIFTPTETSGTTARSNAEKSSQSVNNPFNQLLTKEISKTNSNNINNNNNANNKNASVNNSRISNDKIVNERNLARTLENKLINKPVVAPANNEEKTSSQSNSSIEKKDTEESSIVPAESSSDNTNQLIAFVENLEKFQVTLPITDIKSASDTENLIDADLLSKIAKDEKSTKPSVIGGAFDLGKDSLETGLVDGNDTALRKSLTEQPGIQEKSTFQDKNADTSKLLADKKGDTQLQTGQLNKEFATSLVTPLPAAQSFTQQVSLVINQSNPSSSPAHLMPHVGTPAWDQAVGQKVVWMVAGGQQTAELTLNPPDLGPLQVVISVNNDQANATFFSDQAAVREALEAALPKLRQMMSDAGVQLSGFSVGSQASGQGNSFSRQGDSAHERNYSGNKVTETSMINSASKTSIIMGKEGLVDTFA